MVEKLHCATRTMAARNGANGKGEAKPSFLEELAASGMTGEAELYRLALEHAGRTRSEAERMRERALATAESKGGSDGSSQATGHP